MNAKRSLPAGDLIDVLQSAYDVEQSKEDWLKGILRTARSALDLGRGVGGILYTLGANGTITVEAREGLGFPESFFEVSATLHADPSLASEMHRGYSTFPLCSTFRPFLETCEAPVREAVDRAYAPFDIRDQLVIQTVEPSGLGVQVLAFAKERVRLSRQRKEVLSRMATHFATAYRLQRRLSQSAAAPAPAEAVLEPYGRVAHAEPVAQSAEARESLCEAVRMREWARGRARTEESDRALSAWKGLVSSRWTLVDQVEADGKRYVLARENTPTSTGLWNLSQRERHVATLAALGRSNKLIAYELDLAHSTVRVLMARAAHKLGASSRTDLITRVRALEHAHHE